MDLTIELMGKSRNFWTNEQMRNFEIQVTEYLENMEFPGKIKGIKIENQNFEEVKDTIIYKVNVYFRDIYLFIPMKAVFKKHQLIDLYKI